MIGQYFALCLPRVHAADVVCCECQFVVENVQQVVFYAAFPIVGRFYCSAAVNFCAFSALLL